MKELNTIINSDCLVGLKSLPDECVNCCVTSPPYFGLRDYGHDGQIGLEETPEQYVAKLVDVFREVKRVLRDDGTLWLNLGDSYTGGGAGRNDGNHRADGRQGGMSYKASGVTHNRGLCGLKSKDLIGIPWMVAFALRADGWYLRQDIIWHKPNPMPESVTDRCTKSHEYIFLLSKSAKYYYDQDAIKEPYTEPMNRWGGVNLKEPSGGFDVSQNEPNGNIAAKRARNMRPDENGRNKRSVWTVTTKPYSEAHFATYPQDLIVDCIKAGCPEKGIVLDPFMGAGTTAMVARKLNRNYIGYELNPEYIRIAQNRLQTELGLIF